MTPNPLGGLIAPRMVRIFVAYDQPEAGQRAQTLCAQLEDTESYSSDVQPWQFEAIAAGELEVRNSVTHADIVVVAWSTPEGPPEYLFQWVLDWAVQRSVANATLAALPVGAALARAAAAPVIHRLRQLASAAGLVFVCDWTEGLSPRTREASTTMHDREQMLTPTLVGILAEPHFHPHLDWGLNE